MLLMLFEAVFSEGKGRSSFEPFRWQSHAVTNNKKEPDSSFVDQPPCCLIYLIWLCQGCFPFCLISSNQIISAFENM